MSNSTQTPSSYFTRGARNPSSGRDQGPGRDQASGASLVPVLPDRDMAAVLLAHAALHPRAIENLSPAQARLQPTPSDGVKALLQARGAPATPLPGVDSEDTTYLSDAGEQKARVYRPESVRGPLPVILYFRGGGWVIADLDVYDANPRALARRAQAVVVSADYRMGPEAKFPAAHEDALAAYKYVLAHAEEWGGDPTRIALVGESAGGNLAINVAIAARDKDLPLPDHAVLVYPVAGTDTDTPSYRDSAEAKPLNAAMMGWFVKHATNGGSDLGDPRLNLTTARLAGLPSITIITAGIDPLRSDGERLTEALAEAGVAVQARNYAGATHEFFGMSAVVRAADQAQDYAVERIRQAWAAK